MDKIVNDEHFQEQLNKIQKNSKIVFCDIDGTIYRDSLFLDLIELLIENGHIDDEKHINGYFNHKQDWKNRKISYEDFLTYTIQNLFNSVLHSGNINDILLKEYANIIINRKGGYVLLYTLNKLQQLKKEGYTIIFISGSPNEIVQAFINNYNFNIGLGTLLEKDNNGNYTGNQIVLAYSEVKKQIIEYIKNKLTPIITISFGDTNGDYDMLNSTDIGIAINPSLELYEKIKYKNNIYVIIERKDLIIELDKNARQITNVI